MLAQVTSRHYPLWLVRALRITFFSVLIAIAARISIEVPGTPIKITMQVISVLLAGMLLGPIEGAISVAAYVGAIALGAPIDSRGIGSLALVGPSAGFLIGFILAAFIAGLGWRLPERVKLVVSILLGLAALVVIYFFGVLGLLPSNGGSWAIAFAKGAVPFIFIDLGKVLFAASLSMLGRESWQRWGLPRLK
jgi:biotin transport system substrate-specific component